MPERASVRLVMRPAASYPYVVVLPFASIIDARLPAPSYVYRVERFVVVVPLTAVVHGTASAWRSTVAFSSTRHRRSLASYA